VIDQPGTVPHGRTVRRIEPRDQNPDVGHAVAAVIAWPKRDRTRHNRSRTIINTAARRFVNAVNNGSTDQVMATLAGDAVVIDSGRRFADAGSIRDWIDTEVTGVDGRITVRSEQATSDGAELRVDFQSSGFNGTNLRYRFSTRGDRITNLTLG
jgi:hypothetical protein